MQKRDVGSNYFTPPNAKHRTSRDLQATIFQVLGIDPSISFDNNAGRPVPALDKGEAIYELV